MTMKIKEMHQLLCNLASSPAAKSAFSAVVAQGHAATTTWGVSKGMSVEQAGEFAAIKANVLSGLEQIEVWLLGLSTAMINCRPDYGPPPAGLQAQPLPSIGNATWTPNAMSLIGEEYLRGAKNQAQATAAYHSLADDFDAQGASAADVQRIRDLRTLL